MKKNIQFSEYNFGASKGFLKAYKGTIKPSEAPQRSVKIKISVFFYVQDRGGKG